MRQSILMVISLVLGFAAGWSLRDAQTPPRGGSLVTELGVTSATPVPIDSNGAQDFTLPVDRFRQAMDGAAGDLRRGQYEAAYEQLLIAATLANDNTQQSEFALLLANLVEALSKEFMALRQAQRLDEFYERLSFDFPQYAEYQLRLGKLRVQMGNEQAALPPLAQVINHPQYGAEARALMDQIENSDDRFGVAEVPLAGNGNQFVVVAMIDGTYPVRLLVDTGAAITAIDEEVLRRAGYDLNSDLQYFATANGPVQAPVLNLGELSLGAATIANLSVGALSLEMPGEVVGLLGMNFLRHYEFRIDQGRRVLVLDQR